MNMATPGSSGEMYKGCRVVIPHVNVGVLENLINNTRCWKYIEMTTLEEWKQYLEHFLGALEEMPEFQKLLPQIEPLVFQYDITDNKEMNYWKLMANGDIKWEMGEYSGDEAPTIIHSACLDIIKKVNAGETNPIEETAAGNYKVDGDMTKLMAAVPLLSLYGKAHEIAMAKYDKLIASEGVEKKEKPQKKKEKKKKESELEWSKRAKEIYEGVIQNTSKLMKPIAKRVISGLSKKNAIKRNSSIIEENDVVDAFLKGTPGPFQKDMKRDLRNLGVEVD
ncbi:MAG: hypothetical protein ACFFCS_24130 [Candidatus Hodarchaeota archaeon]